ncbi:MAG: HAD-IIB family hydrolase [Spirochaetales bacterium]|nr:HAD-IIB family hydrolase [Spirochaetales bacterium]
MIISDLDGTLLNSQKEIGQRDRETLEQAKNMNIIRVMATGRHLFSITKTFGDNPPFDYAVLSCGNGIYSFAEKQWIRSLCFSQKETHSIYDNLHKMKIDFMAHAPLPDNHYFEYCNFGKITQAFQHRLDIYQDYARVFNRSKPLFPEISQIVIICEADSFGSCFDLIQSVFSQYTIVYSSSPLQDGSIWLEILPAQASKARASMALCQFLGIEPTKVLALGNDFNDRDLLEWAPYSYIVENAPEALKQGFQLVGSHNDNPLTQAFYHWISQMSIT